MTASVSQPSSPSPQQRQPLLPPEAHPKHQLKHWPTYQPQHTERPTVVTHSTTRRIIPIPTLHLRLHNNEDREQRPTNRNTRTNQRNRSVRHPLLLIFIILLTLFRRLRRRKQSRPHGHSTRNNDHKNQRWLHASPLSFNPHHTTSQPRKPKIMGCPALTRQGKAGTNRPQTPSPYSSSLFFPRGRTINNNTKCPPTNTTATPPAIT